MSTSAAVIRATSAREGAFSRRAHGRLRTEVAAAFRRVARSQLEQGVRAQRVAVVSILVAAGDRQHAETQHGGKGVDDLCLIAPIADAACQRVSQAQAALRLAQQDKPADRRDQAAIEGGGHLLALHGCREHSELTGLCTR